MVVMTSLHFIVIACFLVSPIAGSYLPRGSHLCEVLQLTKPFPLLSLDPHNREQGGLIVVTSGPGGCHDGGRYRTRLEKQCSASGCPGGSGKASG